MFRYLLLAIFLSIFSLDAKAQDEFILKHLAITPEDTEKIWEAHSDLKDKVKELQKIQGYTYSNPHIAALAMIRPSEAHNLAKYIHKLEFLSVHYLKVIISELYMYLYPKWSEGDLTHAVTGAVDPEFLRNLSEQIGIDDLIIKNNSRDNHKSNSYVMKAIIAALWINGGKEKASQWVQKILAQNINIDELNQFTNRKDSFDFKMSQLTDSFYMPVIDELRNKFPFLYLNLLELQKIQDYQYNNLFLPALVLIRPEEKNLLGIATQRLEFLGDSYLNLIIAELCLNKYPEWTIRQISELQTQIMSNIFLAEVTSEIGLDQLIYRIPNTTLEFKYKADAYEATVAVLWLTAGREKTYQWVEKLFNARDHEYVLKMAKAIEIFQEWAIHNFGIEPIYKVEEIKVYKITPNNKYKTTNYLSKVFLGGRFITEAKASRRKQAILLSAGKALVMALEGQIMPSKMRKIFVQKMRFLKKCFKYLNLKIHHKA